MITRTVFGVSMALMVLATSPALSGSCPNITALEQFSQGETPPDGALCARFATPSGRTGTSCHWSFAYRAEHAESFAAEMWDILKSCRPGQVNQPDRTVNHPDSYVPRSWQVQDRTYTVSIKDKAQQNRTLVFLRLE
ncbi:MAG: hypothetical protein AAGA78_12355 [Pseudomonadota bacterium]